jgi:hypothetical protein
MSGQEEQQPQIQQQQGGDASVVMPIARSSLLDFLYISGVPILPYYGGGGGVVGGGLGSQNVEMEQVVASILADSLYERNPVKKVFDEEAETCEIIDKKFTGTLVEEMKINSACGIWQEDFNEGEDIKILPCNHAFKSQAIMKWLKEEKAECPMCRFALKSKELLCRENEERNDYDDDDDDDEDEEAVAPEPQPDPEPQLNNDDVRINDIASRLFASRLTVGVVGRMNQMHRDLHRGYDESISIPINRLIENRRNLISQARNVAAGAGMQARAAAYANANREVREEAIQHAATAAAAVNNNNPNPNPNYNIINNNYYYYDINSNGNNNYNNNNNYDEDFMLNQEQADIEEAIRRSLEQI